LIGDGAATVEMNVVVVPGISHEVHLVRGGRTDRPGPRRRTTVPVSDPRLIVFRDQPGLVPPPSHPLILSGSCSGSSS
jgi:hypothetical protein